MTASHPFRRFGSEFSIAGVDPKRLSDTYRIMPMGAPLRERRPRNMTLTRGSLSSSELTFCNHAALFDLIWFLCSTGGATIIARPSSVRVGTTLSSEGTQQAEILMVEEDVDRVYCTVLDYGLESRAGRAVF